MVRAGPEPGISRFQIRRPNHSATRVLVCYGQYSHECCLLSKQRVCFCLHGAMWMNPYKVMTSDMPAETDIHLNPDGVKRTNLSCYYRYNGIQKQNNKRILHDPQICTLDLHAVVLCPLMPLVSNTNSAQINRQHRSCFSTRCFEYHNTILKTESGRRWKGTGK